MPSQPGLKWQDLSEERGLRKRAPHAAADFTLCSWPILKLYKDERVVIKKKKSRIFGNLKVKIHQEGRVLVNI